MDFDENEKRFRPTEEQNQMIKEAFDLYNHDGFISREKMMNAFVFLGLDLSEKEIWNIFNISDTREIILFNYQQFVNTITVAFKFNYQNKPKYTFEQLRQLSSEMGYFLPDDEIKKFIYEQNNQDDIEITEEEFCRIMKQALF